MPKRILVVDDSPTMRNLVKQSLQDNGFEISSAQDGKKALSEVKSNDFNLIITDINMPNMNGIDLIKECRDLPNHKNTPILIITTEGNEKTRSEGKDAGANGWIVKPFSPEVLVRAVAKLIQ